MPARKRSKRAPAKSTAKPRRRARPSPKRAASARSRKATARPRSRKAAARSRSRKSVARSRSPKAARPRAGAKAARRAPARPAAESFPSAIGATHQHMDYTSHALEDVRRFYTEVLGFASFQHNPNFQYLSVRTGPSSSLGFMPPMPGPPEQWRPPREPVIYLHVEDVDRAHGELVAKGVTFQQEPTDMPWKHRVAILRDPEGRTVMLAQLIRR